MILVSCGRSGLDAPDPTMPKDPLCADATMASATPTAGYCSDGSNRAPVLAPSHPLIAWTSESDVSDDLLVDDEGVVYGNGTAVDLTGRVLWSSPVRSLAWYLDRDGQLVGSRNGRRAVWSRDGSLISESATPLENRPTMLAPRGGAPSADGTVDMRVTAWRGWTGSLSEIVRTRDDGTTVFSWAARCADTGESDGLGPAAVARLRDGRAVVLCNSWGARVRILDEHGNVDANTAFPDEGVMSSLSINPSGDAIFASAVFEQPMTVHAVNASGAVRWSLALDVAAVSSTAVAADGTILLRTRSELFGINSDGTLRYRVSVPTAQLYLTLPGPSPTGMLVDSNDTVVVWGTSIEGRDLATGALRWSVAAPAKTGFTQVVAAGPRALYAASGGRLSLLRDAR
ncbi:hypothetical protein BH09MYX1_BH09MYX1_11560 [soil metagenome]